MGPTPSGLSCFGNIIIANNNFEICWSSLTGGLDILLLSVYIDIVVCYILLKQTF